MITAVGIITYLVFSIITLFIGKRRKNTEAQTNDKLSNIRGRNTSMPEFKELNIPIRRSNTTKIKMPFRVLIFKESLDFDNCLL